MDQPEMKVDLTYRHGGGEQKEIGLSQMHGKNGNGKNNWADLDIGTLSGHLWEVESTREAFLKGGPLGLRS